MIICLGFCLFCICKFYLVTGIAPQPNVQSMHKVRLLSELQDGGSDVVLHMQERHVGGGNKGLSVSTTVWRACLYSSISSLK